MSVAVPPQSPQLVEALPRGLQSSLAAHSLSVNASLLPLKSLIALHILFCLIQCLLHYLLIGQLQAHTPATLLTVYVFASGAPH